MNKTIHSNNLKICVCIKIKKKKNLRQKVEAVLVWLMWAFVNAKGQFVV